jgi:dipeptidyl-peptidase-3
MHVVHWIAQILLAASPGPQPSNPLAEQIGQTGFYQLESKSFSQLTPKQRLLAYWLGRAAIAVDPIIYDQLSGAGLKEKRLLGAMVEKPDRLPAESRDAIVRFAKLFFAFHGNHNDTTNAKFLPEISFEAFRAAALAARKAGAPLGDEHALETMLTELKPALFDPAFEPTPTAKTPPASQDIITASSNTFYGPGVTLADLKNFHDTHPLNSRVAKENGKLVEQVYRAGTTDGRVKPGLYARELGQAVDALEQARAYAEPKQAEVLEALVRYFRSGEPADWHDFDVKWVQNDAQVDFVNGFVETYRDARSAKGAAEALVSVDDMELSALMKQLAANALHFEQKAPWADAYKKLDVKPPVGKAVEVLVESADFTVSVVGDNLPNEDDIHEKYGTKNFLMTNASEAFDLVRGAALAREFSPDDVERYARVGPAASNLLTALHEITGHGSGKVSSNKPPHETLREYYSTLEEGRADLVGYWSVTDPELSKLGVKDQPEVEREMYWILARSLFGVLVHYPTGDQVEEDHDRNRLLIWNYVAERGGVGVVEKNGKHVSAVLDLEKAHRAVGELLAELMRIKAEGDYAAIAALVKKYGLHFDPKLRDEVVARVKALGLPSYGAGIYGDLELVDDKSGKPVDVKISYGRDFLKQQLGYARINGTLGF